MGFPVGLFVDQEAIRNFQCPLCRDVLQDAVRASCGHSFCQLCIGRAISGTSSASSSATAPTLINNNNNNSSNTCPVCQQALTPSGPDARQLVEDFEARESIAKLVVRCQQAGCTWAGELRNYMQHISEECAFTTVRCPNFPCPTTASRKLIQQHLNVCEFKPALCQYCNNPVPINDRQSHQASCPEMPCPCGFQGFGCEDVVKRKNMAEHLQRCNEKHLMLIIAKSLNTIQVERQKLHDQQQEIARLNSESEQQSKILASQRKELDELRRTVASYLHRAIPRAPS